MFKWTKEEVIVLPIALVIMIALSVLLGCLLKNKSEKIRIIPLQAIAIILLVLEVIKQIYHIANKTYSTWQIPLHFCSTFLIWLPMATLARGKVQQIGKTMSFSFGSLLLISFYIMPSGIIGNSCQNIFANFDMFHTFTYHHLVLLFFFLMIALNIYRPQKSDLKYYSIAFSIYAVSTIVLGHLLNTNYCNILHSNIQILENIRQTAGQLVYTIILIVFGLGAGLLFDYIYCLANSQLAKKASKVHRAEPVLSGDLTESPSSDNAVSDEDEPETKKA